MSFLMNRAIIGRQKHHSAHTVCSEEADCWMLLLYISALAAVARFKTARGKKTSCDVL